MKTNVINLPIPGPEPEDDAPSIEELVKDYLGLDSESLIALRDIAKGDPGGTIRRLLNRETKNSITLYGLQVFMRRVLALAIQFQKVPELCIRLKSDNTAAAHSFPNARIANLAMIFVWSMIREEREDAGLAFARLEAAAKSVKADPPIVIEERLEKMSVDELVEEYLSMPSCSPGAGNEPVPEDAFPVLVSEIIRAELGLEPATLARGYETSGAKTAALFAGKPEMRAMFGVRLLVRRALLQYRVMRTRFPGFTSIRLMSAADAELAELPSARAANITTLLAAALHADEAHRVTFKAPRTRSDEEMAMLRCAARAVYLNYSDEAWEGLDLLCDGNRHFAWPEHYSLGLRLLCEVAADYPDLPIPYAVSIKRWGTRLNDVFSGKERDPDPGVQP